MVPASPAWRLVATLIAASWLQPPAPAAPPEADRFQQARERMVRDDIAGGGVTDPRVLESLRLTPRH